MRNPIRARSAGVILAAATALVASTSATAAAGSWHSNSPKKQAASEQLRAAVTVDGVMSHLRKFQRIADANNGNRAAGLPGYQASADYVAQTMREAGYRVEQREFEFPFFLETEDPALTEVEPQQQTFGEGTDFTTMTFSGSGDVTAAVDGVDLSLTPPRESDSGCQASDFADFHNGAIALLQRGSCSFEKKATNAEAAGAVGVIIFNQGNTPERTGAFGGTLGEIGVEIPVVSASFALGQDLAEPAYPGTKVHMDIQTVAEVRTTTNVIATTEEGDPNHVLMAGAHLDSVPDGPGINDNGSGSAALLEVATQLSELDAEPSKQIKFAWWGAEELGLVGSTKYVQSLSEKKLEDFDRYLNFDMVGSPNYIIGVYDGDGSAFGSKGPKGSGEIEKLFNSYFESQGIPHQPTPFTGRSDYQAFINNGIPAGGLFTGAEGVKTEAEAAKYGGVAGAWYDPCYHQNCDSMTPVADGGDPEAYSTLKTENNLVGNVAPFALNVNSDAIAHAIATFAQVDLDEDDDGDEDDDDEHEEDDD